MRATRYLPSPEIDILNLNTRTLTTILENNFVAVPLVQSEREYNTNTCYVQYKNIQSISLQCFAAYTFHYTAYGTWMVGRTDKCWNTWMPKANLIDLPRINKNRRWFKHMTDILSTGIRRTQMNLFHRGHGVAYLAVKCLLADNKNLTCQGKDYVLAGTRHVWCIDVSGWILQRVKYVYVQ